MALHSGSLALILALPFTMTWGKFLNHILCLNFPFCKVGIIHNYHLIGLPGLNEQFWSFGFSSAELSGHLFYHENAKQTAHWEVPSTRASEGTA